LNIYGNPVLQHVLFDCGDEGGRGRDCDSDGEIPNITKDPKEKAALATLLNTFKGISNLGVVLGEGSRYDSDVEHILQINQAGRKFVSHSGEFLSSGSPPIINNALWPIVLERPYKKSGRIFGLHFKWAVAAREERDKRRCATGLFYLVQHYWPMFMGNHRSLVERNDDGDDDDDDNNNNNNNNNNSNNNNNNKKVTANYTRSSSGSNVVTRKRKRKCSEM
jgi:hypothetical protein